MPSPYNSPCSCGVGVLCSVLVYACRVELMGGVVTLGLSGWTAAQLVGVEGQLSRKQYRQEVGSRCKSR